MISVSLSKDAGQQIGGENRIFPVVGWIIVVPKSFHIWLFGSQLVELFEKDKKVRCFGGVWSGRSWSRGWIRSKYIVQSSQVTNKNEGKNNTQAKQLH